MLRTLKWIYDLGIRHERVRVASHLQIQSTGVRNSNTVMEDMFREEMSKKRPNKTQLERLDFQKAVNHRIEEIIQDMFHDEGQYISGASIMFPDDNLSNNKKETK